MASSSPAPQRALVVVCLITAAWGFTFGVSSQLVPLWLKAAGLGEDAIGWNTGIYYLGITLAAPAVPWLMRRRGAGCVVLGMALFGGSVALFPWVGAPAGWLALRLLQGAAGALSLIPLETCISRISPPEQCSRNFSVYAVALTLSGALGISLGVSLFEPGDAGPFLLAAVVSLLGGLLAVPGLPCLREAEAAPAAAPALALRRGFLSYGTAWCQGFLEGGMLAFLSLYLLSLGLSQDEAAGMMGATMVGVILFQIPVGWLADRFDKTAVLLCCYGVTLAGLALVPFCGPGLWLGVWLFLVGGASGAFYPLGLALLAGRQPGGVVARAYAWYMSMECLGSVVGPVCMGKAQVWGGARALFVVGEGALLLVLASWLALRLLYNARTRAADDAGSNPPTNHASAA